MRAISWTMLLFLAAAATTADRDSNSLRAAAKIPHFNPKLKSFYKFLRNYKPEKFGKYQAAIYKLHKKYSLYKGKLSEQDKTASRDASRSSRQTRPDFAAARHDFDWAVKDDYSGNDFGHQETRDGYDTRGSYYVLLPDGRLQRVSYSVNGDSGFVAQVSYEGEPRYHQASSYHEREAQDSHQASYHPTPRYPRPTMSAYRPTPASGPVARFPSFKSPYRQSYRGLSTIRSTYIL